MSSLNKTDSKLNIAIFMLNIMAVLFSIQVLIKYTFNNNTNFYLIDLSFILIIFYIIYFIFISNKIILNTNINIIIEIITLMFIFTLIVFISGGDQS